MLWKQSVVPEDQEPGQSKKWEHKIEEKRESE